MTLGERFKAAEPFIIGIGLPIAILFCGAMLPIQFSQQSSISKIEVKVDALDKRVDGFSEKVDKLNDHLTETESDPAKVIAELLGVSPLNANIGTVSWVNGKIIVFPKTGEAKTKLISSGYELTAISPTVSGFWRQ